LFVSIVALCVYMHFYMHWQYSFLHTCIHAYMHTCIHAYMHTCLLADLHSRLYHNPALPPPFFITHSGGFFDSQIASKKKSHCGLEGGGVLEIVGGLPRGSKKAVPRMHYMARFDLQDRDRQRQCVSVHMFECACANECVCICLCGCGRVGVGG